MQRCLTGNFSVTKSRTHNPLTIRCAAMATSQRNTSTSQSDIISKIKHDHEELEEYFSNYKEAHRCGNHEEAGKWFNQFVWEISRHAVSEELVLYPLMALQGQCGRELADISRKDHLMTKNILEELQNTLKSYSWSNKAHLASLPVSLSDFMSHHNG